MGYKKIKRCNVCNSNYLELIDKALQDGASAAYLSSTYHLTTSEIENHAIKHLKSYPYETVKNDVSLPIISTVNEVVNCEQIAFDEYCKSLGIYPDDFVNLEHNLHKVIYGGQIAVSLIFFKNAAILDKRLNNHLNGLGNYPGEQIKATRNLFEMYYKMLGVEYSINPNAAIQLLENMGYQITVKQ